MSATLNYTFLQGEISCDTLKLIGCIPGSSRDAVVPSHADRHSNSPRARMEKISDTITSVFRITIKDNPPTVGLGDGAPIWSETFGLGWRLGITHNPQAWFQKVRLHLDHNHTQAEQDRVTVSIRLQETADKGAKEYKERVTTISDFGHGEPASLGLWSPSDFTSHPYVSLTITGTKARLPQPATIPLPSTSLALRQSLESGEFVDTKFYVFSVKRPGFPASKPRVVYANRDSVGLVLPKSTLGTNDELYLHLEAGIVTGAKQVNGSAPAFLVDMTSDHHINKDSVLHEYEYEQDSDLDDDSNDAEPRRNIFRGKSQKAGSSSNPHTPTNPEVYDGTENEFLADPPSYSASNCRMILVKGVAYKTWLSYVHFRYTGQVAFRPLTSVQGSPTRPDDSGQLPPCSPKSMYRLATILGDEKMKELASRAIHQGLSKDNIVEEAFSWFTAQYASISEYEVERVIEHRKSPEVLSALRSQIKAVSLGEKPWAQNVLIAIMDKLNSSEPST